MTRLASAAAVALLATVSSARAHALDEYVQALRVAVSAERITLQLGLTPGVAVAAGIIARIDLDGDGVVSPREAGRYGALVLADLDVSLDGDRCAVELIRVEVPPPDEMREGAGTIRLDAAVRVAPGSGRHAIVVRNRHLAEQSAYLANALLPESDSIGIVRQARDARQQTFMLTFAIDANRSNGIGWSIGGAALLLVHAGWRRRRLA